MQSLPSRYNGDPDILGQVFQRVFDTLSKRRKRIIAGIGEFSLNQIDMAEKIDLARVEMEQALSSDSPDYDRIDALEEQLDWDQLIYSDRQRSNHLSLRNTANNRATPVRDFANAATVDLRSRLMQRPLGKEGNMKHLLIVLSDAVASLGPRPVPTQRC